MSANVGESYNEQILHATIDGETYVNKNPYPSRIEVLLMELKEAIEQGGGAVIDTTVNGTSENAVQNKAIYNYVNSSVSTNTANFIGTFNSVEALESYSGTVTNNDYAFVVGTDSDGNTVYNRYKYNGETETWSFEYALNNSSFTTAQWAAINSGLTSSDKTKLDGLGAASTKGFDASPTSGNTNNAVSSDGVYKALAAITAELATIVDRGAKNLFDFQSWVSQITSIQNGTYTSTDDSITLTATGNDSFTKPQTGGYHIAVKPNTAYVLSLTGADANGQIVLLENDAFSKFYTLDTSSGSCTLNFTTSGTADRLSIRFGVPTSGNSSTISDVMICTKADWDISNSFTKYAPSNRELYEMILAAQS